MPRRSTSWAARVPDGAALTAQIIPAMRASAAAPDNGEREQPLGKAQRSSHGRHGERIWTGVPICMQRSSNVIRSSLDSVWCAAVRSSSAGMDQVGVLTGRNSRLTGDDGNAHSIDESEKGEAIDDANDTNDEKMKCRSGVIKNVFGVVPYEDAPTFNEEAGCRVEQKAVSGSTAPALAGETKPSMEKVVGDGCQVHMLDKFSAHLYSSTKHFFHLGNQHGALARLDPGAIVPTMCVSHAGATKSRQQRKGWRDVEGRHMRSRRDAKSRMRNVQDRLSPLRHACAISHHL